MKTIKTLSVITLLSILAVSFFTSCGKSDGNGVGGNVSFYGAGS